jgi:ABC-type polysaccharide/polyol phosphate export permease
MTPFIRQFHRWTSAAFVLTVIATTIALNQKEPIMWMSYVPLLPLALLALTGIYMFFLPYMRRRGAQQAGG